MPQAQATQAQYRLKVEYRDIARRLCQTDADEPTYSDDLENTLAEVKRLPAQTRLSMRIAEFFSHRVPFEEREDCFQAFTSTLLDAGVTEERLAYTIIRHDWLNWWKAYKTKQHLDLDSSIQDEEGNATTLGDLLVGEVEYQYRVGVAVEDDDAARYLWNQIPANIRPLVAKRLAGQNLTAPRTQREPIEAPLIGKHRKEYARFLRRGRPATGVVLGNTERQQFNRWIHANGASLILASGERAVTENTR
jgi:hypothetical protein